MIEASMVIHDPSYTSSPVLSTDWLKGIEDTPGWRLKVLGRLLKFVSEDIKTIDNIGDDFFLKIDEDVENAELKVFLQMISLLTGSIPRIHRETPDKLILLARP